MASDQARYEHALMLWQEHIDDGNFSEPVTSGSLAILVPYVDLWDQDRDEIDLLPSLASEAYALADQAHETVKCAEVGINADVVDFERALKDPAISDITVIGHGCLASVEVMYPAGNNRLDWEDLARMAGHLKQGNFVQRTCATLPRELNVPLGLFTVTDHRHVEAVVGKRVTNETLAQCTDGHLSPVTDLSVMQYEDIKRAFPKRKLSIVSRAHVAVGAMKRAVLHG